jgi:hypothetical protein
VLQVWRIFSQHGVKLRHQPLRWTNRFSNRDRFVTNRSAGSNPQQGRGRSSALSSPFESYNRAVYARISETSLSLPHFEDWLASKEDLNSRPSRLEVPA